MSLVTNICVEYGEVFVRFIIQGRNRITGTFMHFDTINLSATFFKYRSKQRHKSCINLI